MRELGYLDGREAEARRRIQAVSRGEGPIGRCGKQVAGFTRAHPVLMTTIAAAAGVLLVRALVRSPGMAGAVGLLAKGLKYVLPPGLRMVTSAFTWL